MPTTPSKDEILLQIFDLAHDLKHPIGHLEQQLNRLLVQYEIPEQDPEVNRLRRSIKRLIGMSDRLLHLEGGNQQGELQRLNLSDLILHCCDQTAGQLAARDIDLDLHLPELDLFVHGRQFDLLRAFDNLISNSVKHAPPLTVLSINLTVREELSCIEISNRIEYSQVDSAINTFLNHKNNAEETPRTGGKGLYIMHRIIDNHQGQVEFKVDQDSEGGSVLCRILLPLYG